MTTSIHDDIASLETRRYEAMLAADVATLSSLCHDSLVYTHSNGETDTKASWLDKVLSGHFTYLTIEHPTDQLQVGPDWALVIGAMRASVINGGTERQLNNRALAVWTRHDDAWLFTAYQPTPLGP